MKKNILLGFLLCSNIGFASDKIQIVFKPNKGNDNIGVNIPEGSYNCSKHCLEISFITKDTYTLSVRNNMNEEVCRIPMYTNSSNNYYLPSLETGVNYIYIENDSNSYVGEIFVDEN